MRRNYFAALLWPNCTTVGNGTSQQLIRRCTDGIINFAYINPNYKVRLHPDVLLTAAKAYNERADQRLDKVQGAAHFDLSMKESREIYKQIRSQLPGYLLPVMVEEISGQSSKKPICCD